MVRTDKYKRGIIALAKRAAEFNPKLGEYKGHFLNEQAKFIVQLSHGKLEIDIELAREFEENPEDVKEGELKKLALTYKTTYKTSVGITNVWNGLFEDDKPQSSTGSVFD